MPIDVLNTSQALFGTLRENAPQLSGIDARKWSTSQFEDATTPPDKIQNFLLPGVSPLAKKVELRKSGPAGQINLSELSRWYQDRNSEGKKHTLEEWELTMDFVKQRGVHRNATSAKSRASSSGNRADVAAHLSAARTSVESSFTSHLGEVGKYVSKLEGVKSALSKEIKDMKEAIKELEAWIAARTKWPIKVNEKCMFYRDQRIGIDLVADELEIELGKEYQMLTTVVDANTSEVLSTAYDVLHDMQGILELVMKDIKLKQNSKGLDVKMTKLRETVTQNPHLDSVELRPAAALPVENWRDTTDALLDRAKGTMKDCRKLQKGMKDAAVKSDVVVREFDDNCTRAMDAKLANANTARDEVYALLQATKEELANTEAESRLLNRMIDEQQMPLSFITTRLNERQARPESERTIDQVHESLIKEVAELDTAVSTLQMELNSNLANLDDLNIMDAMLEEDYGIKKVTANIELRCKKIRSFLSPEADNYVVVRMLEDEEFFDLMTR